MLKKIKFGIICFVLLFSSINTFTQTKTSLKNESTDVHSTEGIILNVNSNESSFLIKHTSRIIKFKASNKTASDYKNKNNMKVLIYYQKLKDGTLYITDIKPAD
jgi:hypothetical protein